MPIKPYLLHSGLLAIGALQGSPVKYHPAFQPPTGEKIDITLLWKDKQGRTRKVNAREWVAEAGKHVETVLPDGTVRKEKKTMETGWVFTGSVLYRDEDGMNRYIANETGEMVGLSNFVGSILDVPIQSTDSNDALLFEPYTSRIPPLGTAVTMIFEVEKPAEKPAGPPAVKPADTLSSPAESPKKKPRTP